MGAGVATLVGAGAFVYNLENSTMKLKAEFAIHPPKLPWAHNNKLTGLDKASVRRGLQVYREVCAACHGIQFVRFRELIGVTHTDKEVKEIAAEYEMENAEADDTGHMFMRPCLPADRFPNPYANEEAAKLANNGSIPPDLSLVVFARHGEEDYIFSLLTSYADAPAGMTLDEGQYFHPYFAGSKIAMKQALYNDIIEYEDGTPATVSQMAKDVSTFLRWCVEPEHDDRKKVGMKVLTVLGGMTILSFWMMKHKWGPLKTRKVLFQQRSQTKPSQPGKPTVVQPSRFDQPR